MSGSGGGSGGGIGRREVAVRCFAAEYDDASLEYSESDEERAPNYVVTPTGARVNRLFVVGVLTEVEPVSDDVLRARVVDPTGAFVVYAGQYQPDAKAFLERAEPPEFVAVTGKARTFEPDDADVVYTSVRPESVNAVDPDTRDRWTVQTAEFTLERVAACAAALSREERGDALREALLAAGVDPALAAGIPRAIDHYGTTGAYLEAVREMALAAAEVVAGERDEVEPLSLSPDEGGAGDVDLAGDLDVEAAVAAETETAASTEAPAGSGGEVEAVEDATSTAQTPGGVPEEQEADEEAAAEAGPADGEGDAAAASEADDLGDFDDGTDAEGAGSDAGEASAVDEGESASDDVGSTAQDVDASAEQVDAGAEQVDAGTEQPEASTDELYEMDDAEREAIEEEYGTEFSTGSEVGGPGEADVETPGPVDDVEDEASETAAPAEGSTGDETEDVSTAAPAAPEDEAAAPGDEAGFETAEAEGGTDADDGSAAEEEGDGGPAEDEGDEAAGPGGDEVDLEDAVIDAMAELDEGDGADREAVVEQVAAEYDADRGAVEDAIQDALMGGRCYEPQDGRLKAI